jgi:hypothetical protein
VKKCFRVYGPENATFGGSWKPGDFEELSEKLTSALKQFDLKSD